MIVDTSYKTVRYGHVRSYRGARIESIEGQLTLSVGHGPTGGADWIAREGYIERIPVDTNQIRLVVTMTSINEVPRYRAEIRYADRRIPADPYKTFPSEDDALASAVSPDTRGNIEVRYLFPSYNCAEPALSWEQAKTTAMADPITRRWVLECPWMLACLSEVQRTKQCPNGWAFV